MGDKAFFEGDYTKAEVEFSRALKKDPKYYRILKSLAETKMKLNKFIEAENEVEAEVEVEIEVLATRRQKRRKRSRIEGGKVEGGKMDRQKVE